ncbi:extracellular solute-binding protein [Paenibacillus sp. FSL R7-0273]|uniref:extracellular solute-binding protein n=1 Tax=Paenibacillus sp. FSL R7-0273 TaxID=1536772 RepID=UPI00063F36CF|nr:extracellular solute-binding protein [Paenibacillus sp. FSL R7-0273]OMF95390.1 ABC transporter substrate-binding protein [Paenibacillus sp. FSL R7-0273]
MRRASRRIMFSLMTFLLAGSTLTGCSGNNGNKEAAPSTDSSTEAAAVTYPIETDKTLTYWGALPNALTGVRSEHAEVPFYQEWQKQTGIKVDFTAPPTNQIDESFNVMLASGELPDMLEYNFFGFPGGPEKAIKDGYILELNELIDKYAPNYKKYLQEHPEVEKMVKTDNGSYYAFPFIRGDESLLTFQGPVIRKDWLDELGLPVPETIDEWTATLKAFKEKKGAAAPISFVGKPRVFNELGNGAFVGAFGVTRDFYLEDGKVKFGPAEPGYKDFLSLFRQWYAEGLLDKDVATVDSKVMDANITSGATGATWGNSGGGIGKWTPILKEKDSKASIIAAPYPVLEKGTTPKFGQRDYFMSTGGMVAISATSKNAELAVKLLDYGYSEAGSMLFNFGTEGVSYALENGEPVFTDLLMNNPEKLAPAQAMSLYIRGNTMGPFVSDKRVSEQYLNLPEQQEAVATWQKTDMAKYQIPLVTPTPEESAEFANIMADVNTLVDEMTLKIILGTEPLEAYSGYLDKLNSVKLSRAIEIKQAALERYLQR